jgi:hypothetical protein
MELWVQLLFAALLASMTGIIGYMAVGIRDLNDKILEIIRHLENHEGRISGLEKKKSRGSKS